MASQSILLPPRSLYTPSLSSSTSSASSLSTSPAPRHIRFAPLPDPRRAVLVTDDGAELPIPFGAENAFSASLLLTSPADACDPPLDAYASSTISTSSSASASAASTPRTATPSEYSPVSSVGSSPVTATAALPAPAKSADLPPPESSLSAAAPTWPKPRSLNLLRHPFKKSPASSSGSSSHSLTPTPSIDTAGNGHAVSARKSLSLSTEEILTLGTINLFRTSSRESHDSSATATTTGWGLARWTSGPNPNAKDSALLGGSPLARTQSTQSYKSRSKGLFGALGGGSTASLADARPRPPPPSTRTPPATPSRLKGTRMLNGRVYGARRNANPFANVRDEEPEFVEWGYGGMGSVKGARSAGVTGASGGGVNWSRLHGNADSRAAPAVVEDDDDGSGMGWVKRRKEERERKAREEKERAEKEAAEKEKETEREAERSDSQMSTPTPTRSSSMMDGGFALLGAAPAPVAPDNAANDSTVPASTFPSAAASPGDDDAIKAPAPPFSAEPDAMQLPAEDEACWSASTVTPSAALMNGFSFGAAAAAVDEPEHERGKEHVAVLVPVPVRPRHHRMHSRTLSSGSEKTAAQPAIAHIEEAPAHVRARSDSSVSASESESGSGSGSESESDEREEDDDDADADAEAEELAAAASDAAQRRKTMLGAGVEKVMRHTHKE